MTRAVLTGLALYFSAWTFAELWTRASRPRSCPRGHRDLYHLLHWRCRVCDAKPARRPKRGPR
jgi:hypothetical protein